MRVVVFILLIVGAFGQWPTQNPQKPQYFKYNCSITEQSFNSTSSLILDDCQCGCTSQYFVCGPTIVNDYCCQAVACNGAQFRKCFQKQIQCNSVYMNLEVSPIIPNAPKNFTLRQVYQETCECDDQDCNDRTSRYKNQEFVECWTDGLTILLEPQEKDTESNHTITIVLSILCPLFFLLLCCIAYEQDEKTRICCDNFWSCSWIRLRPNQNRQDIRQENQQNEPSPEIKEKMLEEQKRQENLAKMLKEINDKKQEEKKVNPWMSKPIPFIMPPQKHSNLGIILNPPKYDYPPIMSPPDYDRPPSYHEPCDEEKCDGSHSDHHDCEEGAAPDHHDNNDHDDGGNDDGGGCD